MKKAAIECHEISYDKTFLYLKKLIIFIISYYKNYIKLHFMEDNYQ